MPVLKPTSGPWRHTLGGSVRSAEGTIIARTVAADVGLGTRIANARLMAAAPELLAACEVLMGDVESYRSRGGTLTAKEEEHVAIMKAAIAKAIGK